MADEHRARIQRLHAVVGDDVAFQLEPRAVHVLNIRFSERLLHESGACRMIGSLGFVS